MDGIVEGAGGEGMPMQDGMEFQMDAGGAPAHEGIPRVY